MAQGGVAYLRGTSVGGAAAADDDEPTVFDAGQRRAWLRGIGVVALTVAFIAVFPFVGYPIAVAALIFAMAVYFGMPLTWRIPVVAVGGALAMWVLFGVLFGVRLPMGLLAPLVG